MLLLLLLLVDVVVVVVVSFHQHKHDDVADAVEDAISIIQSISCAVTSQLYLAGNQTNYSDCKVAVVVVFFFFFFGCWIIIGFDDEAKSEQLCRLSFVVVVLFV